MSKFESFEGDIMVFSAQPGDWYSKAQRIFTKMDWTHAGVGLSNYYSEHMYLDTKEISLSNKLSPIFNDPKQKFVVYEFVGFTDEQKYEIGKRIWGERLDKYYGFVQILWFIYRAIMERWFNKDVRRNKVPFRGGYICSENTYRAIEIALEYMTLPNKLKTQIVLRQWTSNTVHAGDIYTIMEMLVKFNICKVKFTQNV